MIRGAVAFTAMCAMTASAAAQDLRGVVRDGRSGQPVPGATIQLIGAAGNEITRTLTNEKGEYRIRVPAAGTVRVLRLGFRPFEQATPLLPSDARLDVQLRALATMLEIIKVIDQPGCPRRNDRAAALALWEQAKAGLLASVVSRERLPGDMRVLLFQRWLNPGNEKITEQHVRIHDGTAASSFRSALDAGDFVKNGFVSPGNANNEYHAPDADVLLDARFAQGYCFSLAQRERGRPTQVGLSFAPQRFLGGITSVEGTLWIDTAARRLNDIKYTYFREGSRTRSGGEINFTELESGLVLIDRWSIRMVNGGAPAAAEVNVRGLSAFETPTSSPQFWTRMNDGGGELARATWPGSLTWRAPLGTLHATVQNKAGAPQPGVALRLSNTDYAAISDSAGIVHIGELLPGPYTVEIEDSTLATIGLPIVTRTRFTAERAVTTDLPIRAESAEELVGKMCQDDKVYEPDSYKLIVRVVDKTGAPVSRAFIELGKAPGNASGEGFYVWCKGLKAGDGFPVKAWSGGGPMTLTSVVLERRVTALRIVVER